MRVLIVRPAGTSHHIPWLGFTLELVDVTDHPTYPVIAAYRNADGLHRMAYSVGEVQIIEGPSTDPVYDQYGF